MTRLACASYVSQSRLSRSISYQHIGKVRQLQNLHRIPLPLPRIDNRTSPQKASPRGGTSTWSPTNYSFHRRIVRHYRAAAAAGGGPKK